MPSNLISLYFYVNLILHNEQITSANEKQRNLHPDRKSYLDLIHDKSINLSHFKDGHPLVYYFCQLLGADPSSFLLKELRA
jgi:hypothetical protein